MDFLDDLRLTDDLTEQGRRDVHVLREQKLPAGELTSFLAPLLADPVGGAVADHVLSPPEAASSALMLWIASAKTCSSCGTSLPSASSCATSCFACCARP